MLSHFSMFIFKNLIPLYFSWNNLTKGKFFSINKLNNNINPWYITGITDGDGSFYVQIKSYKNTKGDKKWKIVLVYRLVASVNIAN